MVRLRALLAAVLVFAAVLVVVPRAAIAAPTALNGFDNFDSYSAGLYPGPNADGEGGFYTFTNDASGCEVTNVESQTTPNSVTGIIRAASADTCKGRFALFESMCGHPEATLSFSWRMNNLPSSSAHRIGLASGSSGPDTFKSFGFQVLSTGAVRAYSRGPSPASEVAGSTVPGFTVVAGTWYEASITSMGCAGSPAQIIVTFPGIGASSVEEPNIPGHVSTDLAYLAFSASGTTATNYIDNLRLSGGAIEIAAAATVCKQTGACGNTVTGWIDDLTGFDADDYGNVVIARTQDQAGTESDIRAFNPASLAQIGTGPFDTDCNRADGIMTLSQYPPGTFYSGFVGCHTTPGSTDTFHIRNADLGAPSFLDTQCGEADFCDIDLQTDATCSLDEADDLFPDAALQVENVVGIPISFAQGFNPTSEQARRVFVGFAYTDVTNGIVGFWVIKMVNNNVDRNCGASLPYAPAGISINAFCSIHYLNQTINPQGDFIGAVASGTSGKFWSLRVANLDDKSQTSYPIPEMNAVGPTLPANVGLGCSSTNDVLTVGSTGQVTRWHIFPGEDRTQPTYTNGVPSYPIQATPGTIAWTIHPTVFSTPSRSIEMDDTGNWGAYLSSATKISILNATDGTIVATVTKPVGTFVGMDLIRNGQTLYVATEDEISRYDIHTATTGTPLCPRCNPDGTLQNTDGTNTGDDTPTDGGGTGSIDGSLVGILDIFLGDLGAIGNLILGFIVIMVFVGIAVYVTRRREGAL